VLTDCDAFDNFPPKAFRTLVIAAKTHTLTAGMLPMRLRAPRRLPFAYGRLTKHRVPDEVLDGWVRPFLSSRGVRRDARRFLAALDPGLLLDNTARLGEFDKPVLLAWAREDPFFPVEHAHRLAAIFPNAHVAEIDDARAFVSWDQPERLAELIGEFMPRAVTTT
jgi:pimeloyl-ACP methyl ester carboxylesterase